ncbi:MULTISPECIES: preprotein translocase subunit SecA [Bacteroides]|jgi:preprotein translocase subunit SecA|uniref:Protein translocase subunit SecA n=2 Tax=Bacteroides clarus TaxID=626929 RepID=A0A1Y4JRX9_9BACE|nr:MULTISPECIES: preprotein translocase subunit SecA [Bacteroides]MBS1306807.1 preprotein translocase subunit SecA [Bacteroides sp.]EGF50809.1 preprotein translocase, SecA subunit [Bacteroides clarus YIT 12056]MBD9145921.1 preprotein translocase subunit SecA [Bacteroides clarus]MCQ1544246.1 preprotein translocase subunit SecA [Bacteroides clarus]OKZ02648.1 MAG: preprotein translocase subunit SecA [Bacteroides sp. 44_46]
MGFNEFLSSIFGNKATRDMKEIKPWVDKVKAAYPEVAALDNDALRAKTEELKAYIRNSATEQRAKVEELKASVESIELEEREEVFAQIDKIEKEILDIYEKALDEVLPVAFSIVKETAKRFSENEEIVVTATEFDRHLAATKDFVRIEGDKAVYQNHWVAGGNDTLWNMVHYDVQLFGGVVLHKGKIAEMATGEGKTLVATLPVFLNALTGNGVHVVTVNDYLAKRDSEWMGPLYMFHGLSVDCIDRHQPNSDARRQAYLADITFGTNNEFGFDYLRDNMAISPKDLVQRQHNYAIVDEVDSVLIDDARTPLIISGPVPKGDDQLFEQLRPQVERLVEAQKKLATQYLADAKRLIASNDKKEQEEGFLALYRSHKCLPKNKALIKFLSEQGIKAGMLKTEEIYMEQNNKRMHEVTDPLYFVIDEKLNSVDLTDKGVDLISGNSEDPTFFVLPDITAQLSELENEKSLTDEERLAKKDALMTNFAIKSERVHTINQLLKAYTMFEKDDEYVVIDGQVKIVDEQTGRIMEGRRYSDGLHQAIEAKEGVKVEAATQTFATITLQNYFRMYHKLSGMTGTAETEAGELWDIYKLDVVVIPTNRPIARNDMNDRVYKTKREKYKAVIEEIEKMVEAGRPVLVGTTSVEISEMLSKMLTMRKIEHNVLNAKLHQKEADIVAKAGLSCAVTIATNMAGRGTDIKLSPEVKAAGGLAIIGTERHESRRVDRQLRGRAGRQGDPGSSVFFVSLEDDLMRLFSSDRIAGVMDKLGFKEGEMIEHSMISKSIERAQKKVEENNFGIRKRLLEYDDVMNKQRTVVYTKRRHALMGERIGMDIVNMIWDRCVNAIEAPTYEDCKMDLLQTLAMETPFTEEAFRNEKKEKLADKTFDAAMELFKRKTERMAQIAYPVIKQVYENQGHMYENILIPITDGKRMYNISCNLKAAYDSECKEVVKSFEKSILLHVIDEAWKENLRELDELKHSVQNASYEQKDPLLIYKLESVNLFDTMVDKINNQTVSILMRGQIPVQEPQEVRQAAPEQRQDLSKYREQKQDLNDPNQQAAAQQDTREQQKREPIRAEKTVGRNDPCPCGSGKKYKNCHGKNA